MGFPSPILHSYINLKFVWLENIFAHYTGLLLKCTSIYRTELIEKHHIFSKITFSKLNCLADKNVS